VKGYNRGLSDRYLAALTDVREAVYVLRIIKVEMLNKRRTGEILFEKMKSFFR